MSQADKNHPLESRAVGPYSAAIWQNTYRAADGTERTMKSVSLRRGYFDRKRNELVEQKLTINPAEVGCVIGLLQQMERALLSQVRTNNQHDSVPEMTDEVAPF
jgi:hypothetical protein